MGNMGILSLLHRKFVFPPSISTNNVSGLGPFNFGPTAFQNLLFQAGYDPALSTSTNAVPCGSGDCFLPFAGNPQSINSIVLKTNGISFALQAALFLVIGSFADYGKWRPWILVFWTFVSWAVGFGWLGVHTAEKWQAGTALYILGCNPQLDVTDNSDWLSTCVDILDGCVSSVGEGYT
jgi:MFS-type transporter involved in bile tolerance (Atg22 family)